MNIVLPVAHECRRVLWAGLLQKLDHMLRGGGADRIWGANTLEVALCCPSHSRVVVRRGQ